MLWNRRTGISIADGLFKRQNAIYILRDTNLMWLICILAQVGLYMGHSGGDLAPSLADRKNFRGPRFLNDVCFGKNFHFHDQNF